MSNSTRLISWNGETKPAQVWAEELSLNEQVAWGRIHKLGWSVELVLTAPANLKRSVTWEDKTQSLRAWSLELDIPYSTLYNRLVKLNWSVERAFTTLPDLRFQHKPERKLSLRELLGV